MHKNNELMKNIAELLPNRKDLDGNYDSDERGYNMCLDDVTSIMPSIVKLIAEDVILACRHGVGKDASRDLDAYYLTECQECGECKDETNCLYCDCHTDRRFND